MKDNWVNGDFIDFIDKIVGGGTPSRANTGYWNGNIPWASVKDFKAGCLELLETEETITNSGLRYSASNLIPAGIPIMCTRMAVGRCAISNIPIAINQDLKAFFPNEKIDSQYLLYLLSFLEREFLNLAIGSTVKGITLNALKSFKFSIPKSLSQQQKIAKILSTCDEVIEKTEAAIAKYKVIKQGMMQDLFTRGIDVSTGKLRPSYQEAPELYKESELGMIPKEWEVSTFEEATDIITDFTANGSFESLRVNVKYYYEINYGRLIRLTDLRQNLRNEGVYVSKEGFEFLAKSELRENDIMLANVGEYTGFACLMPKVNYHATIAPNMFLVRMNEDIFNSSFVYFFMTYHVFTQQVDSVSASSATKLLNKTNFRKMILPQPTIEEQRLFSLKVSALDEKLQTEESSLSKYKKLKEGLMQDLLTGKVEVSE